MVNTLKKIVLGALLASTVTVAFGAVNTFACDKADDPAEKWAEAREQIIENYKADLEEKKEEEKAARQAISDEMDYKLRLADEYRKDVAFSDFYVRAVAEESRGLDRKAIKQAQEYAGEYLNYYSWLYSINNSFKNDAERKAFWRDMDQEKWEEFVKKNNVPDYPDWEKGDWEAWKRTMKALYPDLQFGDDEE